MKASQRKLLLIMASVMLAGLCRCPAPRAKDHRTDDFGDHLEHLYEHVLPDPPKPPPKPPPAVVPPAPAPIVVAPPPAQPPVPQPLVINNATGYGVDPATGRIVVVGSDGFIREYTFGSAGVKVNWATGIEGPPEFIAGPGHPPQPLPQTIGGHGPRPPKPTSSAGGGQTSPGATPGGGGSGGSGG